MLSQRSDLGIFFSYLQFEFSSTDHCVLLVAVAREEQCARWGESQRVSGASKLPREAASEHSSCE